MHPLSNPGPASTAAGFDAFLTSISGQGRRRSESSDGSTGSSSFREHCSSSSSDSGDDAQHGLSTYSSSVVDSVVTSDALASWRLSRVLNLGKTQRLVKSHVAQLRNPDREGHKAIAAALLSISEGDRGRHEVIHQLTKGSKHLQSTLHCLYGLADAEASESTDYRSLQSTTMSARLLNMVLGSCKTAKIQEAVSAYLLTSTVCDGAAGIQYILEGWPHILRGIPFVESVLCGYADRLLGIAYDVQGKTSFSHAMRLLESMLRKGMLRANQLRPTTLESIESLLTPPRPTTKARDKSTMTAVRPRGSVSAGLHLIRAMDTPHPNILNSRVMESLIRLTNSHPEWQIRRLAFSTLAQLLPHRPVTLQQAELIDLVIDVLLWNTEWQHSRSSRKWAKSQDVPVIVPHDDAYAMLCLLPSPFLIPVLRSHFKSCKSPRKQAEPLLVLVVEHTKLADPYWPEMLATFIQAGVIDFLLRIALLPLPNELGHRDYRVIQNAKRDALIAVVRIFEQIMAKDVSCVGAEVMSGLEQLSKDEAQPLAVQWQANEALQQWERNIGTLTPWTRTSPTDLPS
ncbi:hypothetical protein FRB96_008022 [Tulasnella sp. 330]|nr:hypothetical protein FRB96_008022 [Tulasnella sp. 330]